MDYKEKYANLLIAVDSEADYETAEKIKQRAEQLDIEGDVE